MDQDFLPLGPGEDLLGVTSQRRQGLGEGALPIGTIGEVHTGKELLATVGTREHEVSL
mgnify:CR=1 FL=1